MTWGARIKNTSGIIQIDEFYRNLALRHTGTFADLSYVGTYIGATETAYIFSVTRACSVPVVAVSPGKDTNQRRFRCQRVVNNGNGTYTFYFYIILGALAAGRTAMRAVRKTEEMEEELEQAE